MNRCGPARAGVIVLLEPPEPPEAEFLETDDGDFIELDDGQFLEVQA